MSLRLLLALCLAAPAVSQERQLELPPAAVAEPDRAEAEASDPGPRLVLDWGFEAKAHFRSSDLNRFPVPFSFDDPRLPPVPGPVFLETVSPGEHLEVSVVTLFADASWGSRVAAHTKIDLIDLYDRNPTSGDRQVDVDEAWLRFGRETAPALLARALRRLLEGGQDAEARAPGRPPPRELRPGLDRLQPLRGPGGRARPRPRPPPLPQGSATQGNPVFIRDPNALAGDNGTEERLRGARPPSAPACRSSTTPRSRTWTPTATSSWGPPSACASPTPPAAGRSTSWPSATAGTWPRPSTSRAPSTAATSTSSGARSTPSPTRASTATRSRRPAPASGSTWGLLPLRPGGRPGPGRPAADRLGGRGRLGHSTCRWLGRRR
jgi:hypothetical protein